MTLKEFICEACVTTFFTVCCLKSNILLTKSESLMNVFCSKKAKILTWQCVNVCCQLSVSQGSLIRCKPRTFLTLPIGLRAISCCVFFLYSKNFKCLLWWKCLSSLYTFTALNTVLSISLPGIRKPLSLKS